MSEIPRVPAVRGKTIRYIWLEGPTQGKTYEHVFHPDGTVEWREVGGAAGKTEPASKSAAPKAAAAEQAPYAAMEAADNVYAVSYLSPNGYTLTVVLDFKTKRMVGIASGATTWVPVAGRFEVVS